MLVEQIINGVILGSMYALIAQGYTLVFGVLNKLNFAHPEIFMMGGFVTVASLALGAPLVIVLPVTLTITGLLGLAVEIVGFRKFRSHDAHITAALSSFALGIIIIDLTQKVWGTEPVALALPDAFRLASIEIAGTRIGVMKLGILLVSLLIMAVLHRVIVSTRWGRQTRAVAESPSAAALFGIDATRISQQVFFTASAMAGFAGLALAVRTGYASSAVGFTFGLKALAIMAIGGMGDLRGALIGGLLVGVLEALAFHWGIGQLADVAVWLLMIVILLIRPAGLFGAPSTRETRA